MFHDYLTTGLAPQNQTRKIKRDAADIILSLHKAVKGIQERVFVYRRPFSSSHPDSVAVIRALDSFFSHGLINGEKCYWRFVTNFLSRSDQEHIKSTWRTTRQRALSLAWLKDGLNAHTLYFQCTAFKGCQLKILNGYYVNGACIRDSRFVDQLLDDVNLLMEIDFEFLPPGDTSIERIPIALPSTTEETVEPEHSIPQLHSLKRARILPVTPLQHIPEVDHSELVAGDAHTSQSLIEMTRNLPPVEIKELPDTGYDNYANYEEHLLDQMTMLHRQPSVSDAVSQVGSDSIPDSAEESAQDPMTTSVMAEGRRGEDLCPSKEEVSDEPREFEHDIEINGAAPKEAMVDNFSDVHTLEPIPGEYQMEQFEVIELGMRVFVDEGERYRKSFFVYMGHSVGNAFQRLFVLTDRRIYLLSYQLFGDSLAVEAVSSMPNSPSDSRPTMAYKVWASVALTDIDCICVGFDYQCFSIECQRQRFSLQGSDHSARNLVVETGSSELTKLILSLLKRALSQLNGSVPNIYTDGTPSSIFLKRFVNLELGQPNSEIIHHTLAYWMEYAAFPFDSEAQGLEGYLNFRDNRGRTWMKMNSYGEWKSAYFVLKGCMLYQFVDSTCKFAEQSWNLRDHIDQVTEVELRNDEQHVFQLSSMDSGTDYQFSCTNMETLKTWIQNVNLALSNTNATPDATPCTVTVSDGSILFAQEGANCAIDGFMRLLKRVDMKDIAEVVSVHTESVYVVVIEHISDASDWIILRTLPELRRLETTLNLKCRIPVTDSVDEHHFGRDKSNLLYKQCLKLPDVWRNTPVDEAS